MATAGVIENLISEDDSTTSMEPLLLDTVDWATRQMVQVSILAVKDDPEILHTIEKGKLFIIYLKQI